MKPGDPDWISLPDWPAFDDQNPLSTPHDIAEEILNNWIVPDIGANGTPPARPSFIMVAGQPGSGKSTTIRQAEISLHGATQKIIADDFDAYIPGYYQLAEIDPARATRAAREAGSGQLAAAILKRARDMRANIVQECATPTGSSRSAKYYRGQGYRTELHLIATPHYQSWTSVVGRADHALRMGYIGTNVLVPRDDHDKCYAGWARAFYDAERNRQYDRICLTKRDGSIRYDNQLETGADGATHWAKPQSALESLLLERHWPLTNDDVRREVAAWRSAIANPKLASAVPDWPLKAYANEMAAFVYRPGSRFHPLTRQPSNSPEAARQWEEFVTADLEFTRKSKDQMGHSEEFDERTHQYSRAVIDLGREAISFDRTALQPVLGKRSYQEPPAGEAAAAFSSMRAGNGAAKRRRLNDRNDRVQGGAIEV